jgi:hypothetical protein
MHYDVASEYPSVNALDADHAVGFKEFVQPLKKYQMVALLVL